MYLYAYHSFMGDIRCMDFNYMNIRNCNTSFFQKFVIITELETMNSIASKGH